MKHRITLHHEQDCSDEPVATLAVECDESAAELLACAMMTYSPYVNGWRVEQSQ